jgi:hypothetical protein
MFIRENLNKEIIKEELMQLEQNAQKKVPPMKKVMA